MNMLGYCGTLAETSGVRWYGHVLSSGVASQILGVANILILGERQFFVWDTASQAQND